MFCWLKTILHYTPISLSFFFFFWWWGGIAIENLSSLPFVSNGMRWWSVKLEQLLIITAIIVIKVVEKYRMKNCISPVVYQGTTRRSCHSNCIFHPCIYCVYFGLTFIWIEYFEAKEDRELYKLWSWEKDKIVILSVEIIFWGLFWYPLTLMLHQD